MRFARRALGSVEVIILVMTVVPIATDQANLSQIVEDASRTHERIEITRNGQRAAVLLGAEDAVSVMEIIAVLSDVALPASHRTGPDDVSAGQIVEGEGLLARLPQIRHPRGRR